MFRVGQKVVCVDDDPSIVGPWRDYPIKGLVYTITATGLTHANDPLRLPCVLVAELKRTKSCPLWAHRFRPVVERKTDISIFKAMLNPSKQSENV